MRLKALIVLLIFPLLAWTQNVVPFKKGALWGYRTRQGKEILPPWFENADSFSNGLAKFQLAGKWGYVDENGTVSIPCRFDIASRFKEGFATVSIGATDYIHRTLGGYGVINQKGEEIIPLKYDLVIAYMGNLFLIYDKGHIGFANRKGKIIIPVNFDGFGGNCTTPDHLKPFKEGLIWLDIKGQYALYDTTGKQIAPMEYYVPTDFKNGKAFAWHKGKYQIINKKLETLREFDFDDKDEFEYGMARVKKGNLLGYIDTNYNYIITPQYKDARLYSNGLIKVSNDSLHGYIDQTGKLIIPMKYKDIDSFSDGIAIFREGDKRGYISSENKIIAPLEYDYAENFQNGLAIVVKNAHALWGVIDKNNKAVIPFKYNNITREWQDYFSCTDDKINSFFKRGKLLFTSGDIKDYKLEHFLYAGKAMMGSIIIFTKNKLQGLMDSTGKIIVPCKYDSIVIHAYNEGYNNAKIQNKWGTIDFSGRTIIPFLYDDPIYFEEDSLAQVKLNGKRIYINKRGQTITEKDKE